jgi:GntR family transcriptional repressor for pyruvate dehydrogenase complex
MVDPPNHDREEDRALNDWSRPSVQTLSDHVAKAILGRIASGALKAGDRLPSQRDLAQTFEVGMSVVREAIQRLQALHVVDAEHGSGTTIRPFHWLPLIYDPSLVGMAVKHIGIADLWEARRLLEGQIVHLAAARATEENLAEIHAVLDQAERCPPDYEAHFALNRDFHLAIARAARNVVLFDLVAPLLKLRVEGEGDRRDIARAIESWSAHRLLYDALESRDPAAVERAILNHFEGWSPLGDAT